MNLGKISTWALAALLALAAGPARAQSGKKVLFVNSYHEGYEWSDGVEKGARLVLEPSGVQLRFHRMDTKRHQDEAFRKQAAEKARAEIDAWKPDLVIVSDDVAAKHVLAAFYRDAAVPFVFCGVNWDASKYGLPYRNATGVLEVALVKELVKSLGDHAKGRRVAILTADSETERIEGPYYRKEVGADLVSETYVKTMAEWKAAFLKAQESADVLLFGNFAGITDWNEQEAAAFALANSKIVSGGMYDFTMPYVMLGLTKVAEEQGTVAAKQALDVLKGASPSAIPIAKNKQAKVLINPKLAAKAGVVFKPELVRVAQVAK
jgi:ABC-type uncharacterized transport system substrate-binding protein